MATKDRLFATHSGDFEAGGTYFELAATATDYPGYAFDLGQCRISDLSDNLIAERLLDVALEDNAKRPLLPEQREELGRIRDAIQAASAFGRNDSITLDLVERIPQLKEAFSHASIEAARLRGADGREVLWASRYDNVRNWRGALPAGVVAGAPQDDATMRETFDRVLMAPDESRGREYDMIHLANEEWDNSVMWMAALEHFAKNPDCRFVDVHEHGGWRLGFCRDDAQIWSTANDGARLDPATPRPTEFSGVTVRRDQGRLAVRREAMRQIANRTEPGLPAMLAEFHDSDLGITRWGWRWGTAAGGLSVGDSLSLPNNVTMTVREILPALTREQCAENERMTELVRHNLQRVGLPKESTMDYEWSEGMPLRDGRPAWPHASEPVRRAIRAAIEGIPLGGVGGAGGNGGARLGLELAKQKPPMPPPPPARGHYEGKKRGMGR